METGVMECWPRVPVHRRLECSICMLFFFLSVSAWVALAPTCARVFQLRKKDALEVIEGWRLGVKNRFKFVSSSCGSI